MPIITLILVLIIVNISWSVPQFARDYNASCTVCHTNIPMLNDVGERFLRNGFRFSPQDLPTLEELITEKNPRFLPLGVMIGANYKDKSIGNNLTGKAKLYLAATITKYLSIFGMTKDVFNSDVPNEPDFFEEKSSILYIQFAFNEPKHLLRAGLMSPFTQFGNIEKAFLDSGLTGIRVVKQIIVGGNKRQQNGKNTQKVITRTVGVYKSPLQNAGISNFKGLEYSYLLNNKILFLLSYGKLVSHGSTQNSNKIQNTGGNDYQLFAGIRFFTDLGYKIGFIFSKNEENGIDNKSFLVPLEKNFFPFYVTSVAVFRDNEKKGNFIGLENSILFTINSNNYVRGIINIGKEENKDTEYGYSLSYSFLFKNHLLFHIVGGYADPVDAEGETQVKFSINLFF